MDGCMYSHVMEKGLLHENSSWGQLAAPRMNPPCCSSSCSSPWENPTWMVHTGEPTCPESNSHHWSITWQLSEMGGSRLESFCMFLCVISRLCETLGFLPSCWIHSRTLAHASLRKFSMIHAEIFLCWFLPLWTFKNNSFFVLIFYTLQILVDCYHMS